VTPQNDGAEEREAKSAKGATDLIKRAELTDNVISTGRDWWLRTTDPDAIPVKVLPMPSPSRRQAAIARRSGQFDSSNRDLPELR
jgi:hypothetical protein